MTPADRAALLEVHLRTVLAWLVTNDPSLREAPPVASALLALHEMYGGDNSTFESAFRMRPTPA